MIFERVTPPTDAWRQRLRRANLADETATVEALIGEVAFPPDAQSRIAAQARRLVEGMRARNPAGLDAFRIPLSGSMRGYKSDVEIRLADRQLTIEAKSRARGAASTLPLE